jgi:hypothetical protein
MEHKIMHLLEKCNNIKDLNDIIDKFFDDRNLIGISLKKVDKNESIMMIINKVTEPPIYNFSSIKLSEGHTSTTGVQIQATKKSGLGDGMEYMVVRSFGGSKPRNISGEMYGKVARQGSISLNKINKILSKYNEYIPTVKEIQYSDEELIEKIKYLNDYMINMNSDKCVVSALKNTDVDINRPRLLSKYQSLCLSKILLKNAISIGNISDSIIGEMFYYALSIMYENGRTPKFVRVIDNK